MSGGEGGPSKSIITCSQLPMSILTTGRASCFCGTRLNLAQVTHCCVHCVKSLRIPFHQHWRRKRFIHCSTLRWPPITLLWCSSQHQCFHVICDAALPSGTTGTQLRNSGIGSSMNFSRTPSLAKRNDVSVMEILELKKFLNVGSVRCSGDHVSRNWSPMWRTGSPESAVASSLKLTCFA